MLALPAICSPAPSARALMQHLADCKLVVVHNGLIDLIFLYEAFFADLPPTLTTFVADLAGIFTGGVLDTKYVADYERREKASFLEYLFRKYQRELEFRAGKLAMSFPIRSSFGTVVVERVACGPRAANAEARSPCERYGAHGFCPSGAGCVESHDLDDILDVEEAAAAAKKGKKRKRAAPAAADAAAAAGAPTATTATGPAAPSPDLAGASQGQGASGEPGTATSTYFWTISPLGFCPPPPRHARAV